MILTSMFYIETETPFKHWTCQVLCLGVEQKRLSHSGKPAETLSFTGGVSLAKL
jgi:hypothetical protein